ncbi:MAG: leucine-rich repeat domain-containing protein [Bacteroidales bacterium]|nr:leucine-rich repeat domain-containing protein [Bacteroidales bacterium]
MKQKFFIAVALMLAASGIGRAQNPTTTVTLGNGAQLTFSTWTYQGVTNACLDDATNVDGKTVVIPSQVEIAGTTYDVTMVGPYSFYSSGVAEVVIPDETTDIYFGAFDGCSSLTTVTVGRGVTNIAETAFNDCSSLSTFNLNAVNVTDVDEFDGSGVFGGCIALATINFGADVVGFSSDLFFSLNGTASLSAINIAADRLLPITSSTFGYGQSGVSITVPCSQLAAYQNNTTWRALGSITADCGGATSHTLTVAANDATMGSAWGTCTFSGDTTATIYATPVSGYGFSGWSDGGSDNPRTITVNTDSTVTALFFLPSGTVCDSTVFDTLRVDVYDTTFVELYDTVQTQMYDTLTVSVYDTVYVTIYDTVHITIYDTVRVDPEGIALTMQDPVKVYVGEGQLVVEGAAMGAAISLYDLQGRKLVETRANDERTLLNLPATGAYLLRVGQHPAKKVVVAR